MIAAAPPGPRPDQHPRRATSRATSPRSPSASRGRATAGRRARPVPRAGDHRLPARGPAAQGALPARCHRGGGRARRATAQGIVALVGFPERADDVYNALAVLADGRGEGRLPQGRACPTTACSTSSATSRSATAARSSSSATRGLGLTICEDIWTPGPPRVRRGAGRRAADRSTPPPRPYHAGKGVRARADARPARARQPRRRRLLQPGRRPGRAGLRRPLAASSTTTGEVLARAPQFAEALLVADVDLHGRRCRAPARHAAAPGRRAGRCPQVRHAGPRRPAARRRARRPRRRRRAAARARRRGLRRARARHARLRRARTASAHVVLGLSGGIDSTLVAAVAVDALGRRARRRCVTMPSPLLVRGHAATTRGRWPTTSASSCVELADRPAMEAYDELLADAVRRAASPTSPRRTCRRGSAATC